MNFQATRALATQVDKKERAHHRAALYTHLNQCASCRAAYAARAKMKAEHMQGGDDPKQSAHIFQLHSNHESQSS